MDTCVICFEQMDMQGYQDERPQTLTCIKLDCGHAYHTPCIIGCLSQVDRKCPQCNADKDPVQSLTREGVIRNLINQLKKDDQLKPLLQEFKEAVDEYSSTNTQLKKDIQEYVKKRSAELEYGAKRKYVSGCMSHIRKTAHAVAKQKGPQYVAALKEEEPTRYHTRNCFEKRFFGYTIWRMLFRMKHPYIYVHV